jgi:uncharacterized protein (DUF433 family)
MTTTVVDIGTLIIRDPNLRGGRPIIAETGTSVRRIAFFTSRVTVPKKLLG